MASRVFVRLSLFAGLVALWAAGAARVQAQQLSAAPLTKAQLEQLVAPIALHPDPLLSQMLMASTYPTEVVQAARWAHENPNLTGQALQEAVQKQPWDPSVKALTAMPQALEMMSNKLDWTQRLGDAFLAQQDELLAAVQNLRRRAEAASTSMSIGIISSIASPSLIGPGVTIPGIGATFPIATPRSPTISAMRNVLLLETRIEAKRRRGGVTWGRLRWAGPAVTRRPSPRLR